MEEAQQAVARCSPDELRILSQLQPREVVLVLEAKLLLDATISDVEDAGITAE